MGPHTIPAEGLARDGVEFWFYRKDLQRATETTTRVATEGGVDSKDDLIGYGDNGSGNSATSMVATEVQS